MLPFRLGAALLVASLPVMACGGREQGDMPVEAVADQLSQMRIEPGLWELSSEIVEVRAPDLPREVRNRMVGPRRRIRHCITPALAARPSANFLAARSDRGCRYRNFSVRDGRVLGAMACPDAWAMMIGRYGPERYDMRMAMASPVPGGAMMTIDVRTRGRRLGGCAPLRQAQDGEGASG